MRPDQRRIRYRAAFGLGILAAACSLAALAQTGPAAAQADGAQQIAVQPVSEADQVKAVLAAYKSALERLDLTGVDKLFAPENVVVESGKVEGSYADYLAHHIGPELAEFKTFRFSDYRVDVRIEGPIAIATETYSYRIELKAGGDPIERRGTATTVLKRIDGHWRILTTHSSSRKVS